MDICCLDVFYTGDTRVATLFQSYELEGLGSEMVFVAWWYLSLAAQAV